MTTPVSDPTAWWHGPWLRPGHYILDRHGHHPARDACPFVDAHWLDGGLAPRRPTPGGRLPITVPEHGIVYSLLGSVDQRWQITSRSTEYPQGEFLLHHRLGYTIAAWWDRTQGDSRYACNACFLVDGIGRSADEMFALFPRLFPQQSANLDRAGVRLKFLRWIA